MTPSSRSSMVSLARLDAAARLILRDAELARDAVQEAMVRAWRDLPGLRDPDRFEAWLHRLTVNACLDQARRRRRRVIEVELTPLDDPAVADSSALLADRDLLDYCHSPSSRPSNVPWSCFASSSGSRCRKRPRRSASPSGPRSPASIGRSRRCASSVTSDDIVARRHGRAPRMTPSDRPRITYPGPAPEGLDRPRGTRRPDYRDDLIRRTARTRQRPAWTFIERWLPMSVITVAPRSAPLRAAWLLLHHWASACGARHKPPHRRIWAPATGPRRH